MFNQFIVVGKVCGIDYDTGIMIISVSKGYKMFNTDAKDLIHIRVPEVMLSIDKIKVGDTIFIKGRIGPSEMNGCVVLIAECLSFINSNGKEE